MGTIHATSAREAVTKLYTLPLLAGENVTQQTVPPGTGWRQSISGISGSHRRVT
jgi:Flp pilus assembly CpaF family ATPase